MNRRLSALLLGLLCAFYCLNSCSGHIMRTAPAEEKVNSSSAALLSSEKTSAPTPTPKPAPTPKPSPSPTPTTEPTEEELIAQEGQEAAKLCFAQIGQKYKYGGKSPETGFDCSGLVWYVYSQLGYTLERVANYQAKQGILIEEEKMQPGDLLCFGAPGCVGHVGIYVGEGCYIHAMGAEFGVVLTSLDDPYLKRTYEVRRIVGCEWLESENVAAGMLPPEDATR